MNHFVFTGPESSGKTTLAKYFAEQEKGVFVEEYAREFLTKLNRDYLEKDLVQIAKGQFDLQIKAKLNSKKSLYFDTDLLTIKIWSEYKYGDCDPWILDRILANNEMLYILCKPDIEWETDPLRENPNNRDELYEIYKENLIELKLNFLEINGDLQLRKTFLKEYLASN